MRRRFGNRLLGLAVALGMAALPAAAIAQTQGSGYKPPEHSGNWPGLGSGETRDEVSRSLELGPELQRGRPARAMLADHRKLTSALATLGKQRPGVVDAYVLSVGLDSDPVFGREAREAGKVLSARYSAAGRTLVLAGTDGSKPTDLANGTIAGLTMALARVAELMDPKEDVLVLYVTSHGAPFGIAYHDGDEGYGVLGPVRLASILDELGIKRRLLIVSACYSGVFVPLVSSPTTAVLTAASSERPSFGCRADNDWTFFGDALINRALRKPQPLGDAAAEAQATIGRWEGDAGLRPSDPQVSIGDDVKAWLAPLEAAMPKTASKPVGRPATDALLPGI
ncbi:C13 family peptidase [Sphingomonas canadensis]|uniref:C13 family peptidase n=1 Tax=Sphingomonas canadensis TaxID=1219257 RepID=A0ABW3GZX7_9SPHN|nr:C13 family peptidase [Sphingomonas canadensis]MCW3835319.1 C13 family peptidase [Sphingomonas canadensis]